MLTTSSRFVRPRSGAVLVVAALALAVPLAVGGSRAGAVSGANTITVTAGEYTYKFSGKPTAGWTELEFDNQGVEYHMLGLVRLKGDVTAKQVQKALLSDDEDAGANLVVGDGDVSPWPGLLGPREKMSMYLKLKAGRYGAFCFIPAPDGESHVAHGMVKVFDVAKGKSSLKPPRDGVIDLSLTDTSADLPGDTLPRNVTLKITNDSSTGRTLNIARLAPGVTVEQADAYFSQLFEGEASGTEDPPAVLVGGMLGLRQGATGYLVLSFTPGSYAYGSENDDVEDDPNEVFGTFAVR